MINKQFFSSIDPLKSFKEEAKSKFPNCSFFNHEVNSSIDIGSGMYEGKTITESIITDGKISLQKKNFEKPVVIWANHLLTLENGTSISISIEDATFMIDIIKCLSQEQVDVHIPTEDKETLQKILNFFYGKQLGLYNTNSITFTSPTILVLESLVNGKRKQETINFASGSSSYQKKYNRKKRH